MISWSREVVNRQLDSSFWLIHQITQKSMMQKSYLKSVAFEWRMFNDYQLHSQRPADPEKYKGWTEENRFFHLQYVFVTTHSSACVQQAGILLTFEPILLHICPVFQSPLTSLQSGFYLVVKDRATSRHLDDFFVFVLVVIVSDLGWNEGNTSTKKTNLAWCIFNNNVYITQLLQQQRTRTWLTSTM